MEYRMLSAWDQVAPRAYIRLWYCFPYQQITDLNVLKEHLILALSRLSRRFPDSKGRIFLLPSQTGCLAIRTNDDTNIPLEIFDQRDSFSWNYSQLNSQGFPAEAFVDESFDLPYRLQENQQGIPVLEVHVRLIEGGLLLGIYGHHSIFDASRMDMIVRSFAELTQNPNGMPNVQSSVGLNVESLPLEYNTTHGQPVPDFYELLDRCTEYCLLPSPSGPTQFHMPLTGTPFGDIRKTGRIFIIQDQFIRDLKKELGSMVPTDSQRRQPSAFTCLAAITWAHVTKARLSNIFGSPLSASNGAAFPDEVRLLMSVDWRRRVSTNVMSTSAGNTIALSIASINTATVLAACSDDKDISCPALANIVHTIDEAVLSVNDDFVALRTALIRASSDPRLIGVDVDPRDPCGFYFNTWRHFGTQTRWRLPGFLEKESKSGLAPDAIRRAQGSFNLGAGLVLPSRGDGTKYEILVTLEADAMAVLCADPSWGQWVEQVVL